MTNPTLVRIITWLPIGGIERRLVSVLPRLRDRGYNVRLVCVRELGALAPELQDAGIPVDLVKLRTRLDPAGLRKLAAYMRQHNASIVHTHMYRSNVPGTIAARLAKVPVNFAQVHNVDTWESARQRSMDRFLTRWRTGVICVSGAVQRDVVQTLNIAPERAPILYNGSDTERFRPDAELRRHGREALGVDKDRLVVLVPARIHGNKNPIGVVQAFKEARAKVGTDPLLFWAGKGPMQDRLREAIPAEGLGDCFRLLGARDDMPELYNAADVVLLSSSKEGFSNAVVEALACGKPVVAADVGGNAEAIDSPAVGWIHEAGSHEQLVAQLAEAMSGREALVRRAGACRKRGLRFSLDALIDDTDALYRRALEDRK
ncbi:glycosyltransferase [bacterium]|nr:glycosyltransferase [bacterium]